MSRLLHLFLLLCSASLINAAQCFSSFSRANFTSCEQLSPKFALHWSLVNNNDSISIGLHVDQDDGKSGNWFAFGISESGGMRGSDIVVVLKNDAGQWEASDRFSKDFEMPVADSHQDWTLTQAPVVAADSKSVTAILQRKLKTCDDKDFEIRLGISQPVVWAIGGSPSFGYHGANRGDGRVNFQESERQKADAAALSAIDRSTYKNFTLAMQNYTIPAQETSYMCVNFEFPADQPYHIVEYSPKIDNGLVHHILIYQCQNRPKEPMGQIYECSSMATNCATFTIAWAPGIDLVQYPPQAGFPIGAAPGAMKYAALQMHYNNPDRIEGVVDSSGLRLTYTNVLRKNDIGILMTGSMDINVPPNKEWSTEPNLCPSSCTQRFTENITLISSFLHMHKLGKTIETKHIRNGKEILPIGLKNYYDFNYQGGQVVPESTNTLVPGDQFITVCKFNGKGRNLFTPWGESSQEEMCFNFITYYPRRFEYPEVCFNGYTLDICSSWKNFVAMGVPETQKYMFDIGELRKKQAIPAFTPLSNSTCPSAFEQYTVVKSSAEALVSIKSWFITLSIFMTSLILFT